ncbi:MAG: hypothetical protein IPM54_40970 [Polyangiaceae bacterium]|nr:hypothetical protein [Polyangiaceae bacterium]
MLRKENTEMNYTKIHAAARRVIQLRHIDGHLDPWRLAWCAVFDAFVEHMQWPEHLCGPGLDKIDNLRGVFDPLDKGVMWGSARFVVSNKDNSMDQIVRYGVKPVFASDEPSPLEETTTFAILGSDGEEIGKFFAKEPSKNIELFETMSQSISRGVVVAACSRGAMLYGMFGVAE